MIEQIDAVPLPTDSPLSPMSGNFMDPPTQNNHPIGLPHPPYPQMLPLYEDAFKNMTLVGTIKIYKDEKNNLHVTSG